MVLFSVSWRQIGKCSWWRHQMETFSALLAFCAGNSPVTGEFPTQSPVARSFDVFFDLLLNKRLSKQSWGWWFETPSRSLWRHRNVDCIAGCASLTQTIELVNVKWIALANETVIYNISHCYVMTWACLMTSSNGNIFRVIGPCAGEFPHKGQWRGALIFSLICAWTNGWVNNRYVGDLRRHRVHYDATVMFAASLTLSEGNPPVTANSTGKEPVMGTWVFSLLSTSTNFWKKPSRVTYDLTPPYGHCNYLPYIYIYISYIYPS